MEFLILFIPIAWLLISKYWLHNTITIMEMLIGVVLISSAAAALYFLGISYQAVDEEIWNGQIQSKQKVRMSCGHSYECGCSVGSSSSSCSTCYEHNFDVDWVLHTSAGDITIDRVDSRGLETPPVWEKAYISEPVSIINSYTNYIQAAPSSLFNDAIYSIDDRFKNLIPEYPLDLHNEYSYNHVRAVGVEIKELEKWNSMLAEVLKVLGPEKQVNVIILFVNTDDPKYLHALDKSWLKGNKNDVVIAIGATQYPRIDWVGVMSWSPSELFKVQIRDEIKAIGEADPDTIIPVIQKHVTQSFERMQMADFSHLQGEIEPPRFVILWVLGILIFGPIIYTFFAHKFDTTVILRIPVSLALFGIVATAILHFGVFITIPAIILLGYLTARAVNYFKEKKERLKEADKKN